MTKIMLVEDDKSLREIYGVRLLAEGYEIISAGDGEEALAMAVKERPDLIISDVMMPKISGFDMLDILRSTPETKDMKVIVMTALSSEDQRQRGESLGANKYLVKSQVGIEDVVRAVHEILADAPVKAKDSADMAKAKANETTSARNPIPVPTAPNEAKPVETVNQPNQDQTDQQLPSPTAPFSTAAPASLAEDAINRATNTDVASDIPPIPSTATQPATPPINQPSSPAPAPTPEPANQPITPPTANAQATPNSNDIGAMMNQALQENTPNTNEPTAK